jgi:hypothetical protein
MNGLSMAKGEASRSQNHFVLHLVVGEQSLRWANEVFGGNIL